jgi:predicted alpha/beta hydrolase
MPFIASGDCRLNVLVEGPEDGLPVVLSHHLGGNIACFDAQMPALARAAWYGSIRADTGLAMRRKAAIPSKRWVRMSSRFWMRWAWIAPITSASRKGE